jgi:general secretion pathway protein E
MAQRLVRTLCGDCKQTTELDPDLWTELTAPWSADRPSQVYEAVGCRTCRQSGFYGREGIYEILPISRAVSALIQDDFDLDKLRQQALREGMRTLRLSGAQKIAAGITTAEEVLRVTPAHEH